MQLEPGTKLGNYEVVSSLGVGGMGEVYRAKDTKLGREVAIKLLLDEGSASAERLARFEREAKVLASLNHSNIATLYGFESEGETQFLVMELVEGETLADRIKRSAIPVDEALPLFLQIAEGLEAAHESGVVHRDLKPANIKVSASGRAKILDFGLAKAAAPAGVSEADQAELPTITAAGYDRTVQGQILGTAGYMAPEQARGSDTDKRADIWAFGVCLFEALTGRQTFSGDTLSDKLAAVLKEEPSWGALPGHLPDPLERLLRRCLEKRDGERLRDIGEARILLSRLIADPQATEVVATPTAPQRLWPYAAVGVVALIVGSVLSWVVTRDTSRVSRGVSPGEIRFTIGGENGGELKQVGGLTISPDGRFIVYSGASTDSSLVLGGSRANEPLRIRALGSFDETTRDLEGTEGGLFPFFSPDSQWVGFFLGSGGQRTLHRVHTTNGSVLPITTEPHPGYRADWGEDGVIVLGEQRGALRRVLADGTLTEQIAPSDASLDEVAHVHPEILPNGRGVVFTGLDADQSSTHIGVWDLATGKTKTIIERGGEARYLDSGHLIYGLDGNLLVIEFDLETLEARGDPRLMVKGVRTGTVGEAYFDVSRNGTLVYLPGIVEEARSVILQWVEPDGSFGEEIGRGDLSYPSISEDGRRLIVRSGRSELSLFEIGAPLPLRFTTPIAMVTPPLLFADARSALYSGKGAAASDQVLIYQLLFATGESSPLDFDEANEVQPFALDERRGELIGVKMMGAAADLVVGRLDGTDQIRTLFAGPDPEIGAKLSLDGDLLAYEVVVDSATRTGMLFVADYPQMRRRIPISENSVSAGYAWGPDGALWFGDLSDRSLRVATFESGEDLRLSKIDVATPGGSDFWFERGFAIGPDGRRLMIRAASEAPGQDGRLHVVVGWAQEHKLSSSSFLR